MTAKGRGRSKGASLAKKGAAKVRRRLKVHSRKHGVFASLWAIITATLTIAWLTTGLVLWGVAALVGGLATVLTVLATFDPDVVLTSPAPQRPQKAVPRQGGPQRRRIASPGTTPRPAGAKPRKKVCSARCRESDKPVSHCQCVCGGKTHGIGRRAG